MQTKLIVPVALIALSACMSTPDVNYFTLDMRPSGTIESDLGFVVERFSTTEPLEKRQILIHSSPTRIEYYAADRWSAGIGELVQRKLAAELGPAVEGRRTLVISGRVVAFEQVDDGSGATGRVTLEVTIRDAQQKRYEDPLIDKTYEATSTASAAKPDAVAVALSKATETIAVQIAKDASTL